jgi:tRNA_anti-like
MSRRVKIFFISILAIGLFGFVAYNYVMTGGARDLTTEEVAFTVTSKAITNEFTSNIDACNKKYLEKPVAITGKITSITSDVVTIDNTIFCTLKDKQSSLIKDQNITIKGRVVGFDDLMGELQLDQCYIIKN